MRPDPIFVGGASLRPAPGMDHEEALHLAPDREVREVDERIGQRHRIDHQPLRVLREIAKAVVVIGAGDAVRVRVVVVGVADLPPGAVHQGRQDVKQAVGGLLIEVPHAPRRGIRANREQHVIVEGRRRHRVMGHVGEVHQQHQRRPRAGHGGGDGLGLVDSFSPPQLRQAPQVEHCRAVIPIRRDPREHVGMGRHELRAGGRVGADTRRSRQRRSRQRRSRQRRSCQRRSCQRRSCRQRGRGQPEKTHTRARRCRSAGCHCLSAPVSSVNDSTELRATT